MREYKGKRWVNHKKNCKNEKGFSTFENKRRPCQQLSINANKLPFHKNPDSRSK